MKVETPQILWNSEADKGINAPLLSIDIIASGIANITQQSKHNQIQNEYSHVLVTAGNATSINLWKVSFGLHQKQQQQQAIEKSARGDSNNDSSSSCSDNKNTIFQKQTRPLFNKIDYMMSLTRHDVAVNCVAFSPDGLHLATAGDSGNIIIWSVPVHKRGNNNGRHFWSTLTSEKDLTVRIVSTHCEGVVDLSWSADSKRFSVGTIDSCLLIYEDKFYGVNACSPETHQKESEWQLVFRNSEHGSFVQGVAYDPLGVYIASMGGDRTVRVFPRKTPQKSKKKVLRPANTSTTTTTTNAALVTPPPQDHQRLVAQILTDARVEVGKPKRIKQRSIMVEDTSNNNDNNKTSDEKNMKQIKHKLFVDESNCESFFRRLNWTVDGAFLVTPAALWHEENGTKTTSSSGSPLFSTYLFARHRFDEPYRVLTGLDKPSVVVRPNPVLFALPPSVLENSKENQLPINKMVGSAPSSGSKKHPPGSISPTGLPYRSIFAVLTLDSILVYDTHHAAPLSVIQGLHYSGLTDCCWSPDGMNLMVCSSDGYISMINFNNGDLGEVYTPPSSTTTDVSSSRSDALSRKQKTEVLPPPVELPPLPPCDKDPLSSILVAPAAKKAKKTRITPTLVSTGVQSSSTNVTEGVMSSISSAQATTNITTAKRAISETEIVGEAVTKLSLGGEVNKAAATAGEKPKKKKKRVQPQLISTSF